MFNVSFDSDITFLTKASGEYQVQERIRLRRESGSRADKVQEKTKFWTERG